MRVRMEEVVTRDYFLRFPSCYESASYYEKKEVLHTPQLRFQYHRCHGYNCKTAISRGHWVRLTNDSQAILDVGDRSQLQVCMSLKGPHGGFKKMLPGLSRNSIISRVSDTFFWWKRRLFHGSAPKKGSLYHDLCHNAALPILISPCFMLAHNATKKKVASK